LSPPMISQDFSTEIRAGRFSPLCIGMTVLSESRRHVCGRIGKH
jgi:hypothetical protein